MPSTDRKARTTSQNIDGIDLSKCDREPIHIPGLIQPFGCLLAVSSDWRVTRASANVDTFLEIDAKESLGRPLSDILPAHTIHDLRTQAQLLFSDDTVNRVFGHKLRPAGPAFDLSVHRCDKHYILEFEPSVDATRETDLAAVQRMVARLKGRDTIEALTKEAAKCMRGLSGFDRVMVYRFNHDFSGDVIAEAKKPGMISYLGLRFPASDVPKQARALYLKSTLRLIGDVNAPVVPIEPRQDANGAPLDLSLATTRAVSPVHLKYLQNMGVAASMSVSIIVDGKLWGLFACHHDSPRHLDFRVRTGIELFAQLATYELTQMLSRRAQNQLKAMQSLHQRLLTIAADGKLAENFGDVVEEIGGVISFDGISLALGDTYLSSGAAPTASEFTDLARFLNTAGGSEVFVTAELGKNYPNASEIGDRVAGMLALPISRNPRDYIVLFRREVVQTVLWGGNPDKTATQNTSTGGLEPRASFAQWQELVKGRSTRWTTEEVRAAEAARVTLLEIVLKLSDAANAEQKRAAEQQEILIAELNHRVRNILSLVRSLLQQSRRDDPNEAFDIFSGRITAVARAHDQLTSEQTEDASIQQLMTVEMAAFIGGGETARFQLKGDDVQLGQHAFTCLALVIHELVTNAAKYGALSVPEGVLKVNTSRNANGDLVVRWLETGGPSVSEPKRRGFGSAIIERTVPHELGGTVEVHHKPAGLEAKLTVPARHLVASAPAGKPAKAPVAVHVSGGIKGHILLVEDNAIIAFDTAECLKEAGAIDVISVASVASALAALEDAPFDAAILDLSLGTGTSAPVARVLVERGIPFCLATGYDAPDFVELGIAPVPVLKKPYGSDALVATLGSVMDIS